GNTRGAVPGAFQGIFRPPVLYNKVAIMNTSHSNSPPHDEHSADAREKLCARGPDLLDLAAFVDGTISDDQARQAIDSHLSGCDACREAVDDARQAQLERHADSIVFVPPAVIEAAMALVPADGAATRRLHPLWLPNVRRGGA